MRTLVLLASLIPSTLFAQVQLSSHFIFANPQGDMSFDSRRSFGWDFNAGYQLPGVPIVIGAEFGQSEYASETRDMLPFIDPGYVHDVADITVKNRMSNYLLTFKIIPVKTPFAEPYIELVGGGATYYTKWYARDPWYNNDDNCEGYWARKAYQRDHTYSYGGGFGAVANLAEILGDESLEHVRIDLGVRYIRGGNVDFLNVHQDTNQFRYDSGYPIVTQSSNINSGSNSDGLTERNAAFTRHGGHGTSTTAVDPLTWDVDAEPVEAYNAQHEWAQFRLGVLLTF